MIAITKKTILPFKMFHEALFLIVISTLCTSSFGNNYPSYFVPSQVIYLRPSTSFRVGNQRPPHPEPDAVLINVNTPNGPGAAGRPGPGVHPGGPGVFNPQGGPGVFNPQGGPGVFNPQGGPGGFHPQGNPGIFNPQGGPGGFHPQGGPGVFNPQGGPGGFHPQGGPGVFNPQGGPGGFHPQGGPGAFNPQGGPGIFNPQGGPGVFGQPNGPGVYGHPNARRVPGFPHPGVFGHPQVQPDIFRNMQPQPGSEFVPMIGVDASGAGWGFNMHRPQRPDFPGNNQFIPNIGRRNPSRFNPGTEVQEDSDREMHDDPIAEMFPLIDIVT